MKFFSTIAVLLIAFYIYCKMNWQPSPLQSHYNEDDMLDNIQNLSVASMNLSSVPVAMLGEGWGTSMRLDTTTNNKWSVNPGFTRLNFRFAQPTT
jgi:hypothetical protein